MKRLMVSLMALLMLSACQLQQRPNSEDLSLTAAPTTSVAVVSVCISPAAATPSLDVSNEATLLQNIQDYLNAGGVTGELEQALSDAAWFRSPDASYGGGLWEADVTGDAIGDVIVSLIGSQDGEGRILFRTLLYHCANGAYTLSLNREYRGFVQDARAVIDVVDLTGDGAAEIVGHQRVCGAHTCSFALDVQTWDAANNTMRPLISETAPIAFAQGDYQVVDGTIHVETGFIGSAGAGPQRERQQIYAWNGTAFVLTLDVPTTPPTYRFEAIYDGFAALANSESASAYQWFERALTDSTLQDYSMMGPEDSRALALTANIAQYGLLISAAAAFGLDSSQYADAFTTLDATPPIPASADDAAYLSAWVEMGRAFDQAASTGDLAAGCAAVHPLAEAQTAENIWNTRYFPDYGYANPAPPAQEICPF